MQKAYLALDLSPETLLDLDENKLRDFAYRAPILRRDVATFEFIAWLYSAPCPSEAKQIPLYKSLDDRYFLVQRYLYGDPNYILAYPCFDVPFIPGEYGGIFPFCGNQNLRRDAKTTPLQDHLSDFDQFSASFCANQIHLDSSKPNSQRRILYLCEPKDARFLLTSPTNNLNRHNVDRSTWGHVWNLSDSIPEADRNSLQNINESLYRNRLFSVLKKEQHCLRLERDNDYTRMHRRQRESAEAILRKKTSHIREITAPVINRYRALLDTYNLNFHLCLDIKANSTSYQIDYIELIITACEDYFYFIHFDPTDATIESLPKVLEEHLSAYVQTLENRASPNRYLFTNALPLSSSSAIDRYLLAALPSGA